MYACVYEYMPYMYRCLSRTEASDPLKSESQVVVNHVTWVLVVLHGCWEVNSGLREATKPPLQRPNLLTLTVIL